ncbi:hypothetical protein OF83DRAFT_1171365 [Amylostereum chailletii]|nr:hypothetical protein OF83DRAFT_1171365 [Amylostereum chailletii]
MFLDLFSFFLAVATTVVGRCFLLLGSISSFVLVPAPSLPAPDPASIPPAKTETRKRLDAVGDKDGEILKARMARMELELRETTKGTTTLQAELEEARDNARRLSLDNDALQHQLQCAISSQSTTTSALDVAQSGLAQSELALHHLQTRFQTMQEQLARAQDALDARTKTLDAAEALLGTAAEPVVADKVLADEVEAGLNEAIEQVATKLATSLETGGELRYGDVEETGDVRAAEGVFRRWFSSPSVEELKGVRHREDSTLLEILFRACAVNIVAFIVTRWHFGLEPSQDSLDRLFSTISENEPPAIAGRWKALTRRYAQARGPPSKNEVSSAYVDDIVDMLACVVLAAGLDNSRAHLRSMILGLVGGDVEEIVDCALKLNKTVGEGAAAGVISPIVVRAGETFDPRTMVEGHSATPRLMHVYGAATGLDDRVLCTTGIGLRKEVRDGVPSGGVQMTILVKPVIAMRSILDILPSE